MRVSPRITVFLFLPFLLAEHVPSVEEILHTNQYLLVTQQDGHTLIEREVPAGNCPRSFVHPETTRTKNFHYVGAHLVRDVNGRHPPKLMTIKENAQYIRVNMFDLITAGAFENSPDKQLKFTDTKTDLKSGKFPAIYKENKGRLRLTLFDSTSRTLYLDFSTFDKQIIEEYYIRNLFNGDYFLELRRKLSISSGSDRFDWTEDPYTGKFYYKERIDNEVFLFEIPMPTFVSTIWEGEAGQKVGKLTDDGRLHGATGGAFFAISKKSDNDTYSFFSSLIPSTLKSGISCEIKTDQRDRPFFTNLVIVRNNDYCMLRDGTNYTKEACEEEQRLYEEGDKSDIVKWLLITCIVMFMAIILLLVYIYWLRSTFISENDRTHPNEYEAEASLFVAKQRSFPSGYQDPAFLDVSVDRWN